MHKSRLGYGAGGSTNPERAMEQMGCKKHSPKEAQENQGIDFDMASVNTLLYDIYADMISDHNIVECESVHSMNVV